MQVVNSADTREYYANARSEMLKFVPQQYSRVLEIGCGEGRFASLLDKASELWGVEPDPTAARLASQRMHRVLNGTYDEVASRIPAQYFDVIVCNDVIEHMVEPESFLMSVRDKLTQGGRLIASLPNMRHWEGLYELLVKKDWRYRQSGLLDRTHLRFFTKISMARLFTQAGFAIERIEGINAPRKWTRRLPFVLLSALTAGYYADIQYPQFAILARLSLTLGIG